MAEYISEERKEVIACVMENTGMCYEQAAEAVGSMNGKMRLAFVQAALQASGRFAFKSSPIGIVVGNREYMEVHIVDGEVFVDINEHFNGEVFSITENVMDMEAGELSCIADFMARQWDIAAELIESGCGVPKLAWLYAWLNLRDKELGSVAA